jgi:hypothetical protein
VHIQLMVHHGGARQSCSGYDGQSSKGAWVCMIARFPGMLATRIQSAPGWRGWRAALGPLLAPLKSSALRDRETRVAGKGDVPCGARAAEVGGASLRLVELRVPAGSAEPWLRTQLQPHSIRRPFRHETQNMPLC